MTTTRLQRLAQLPLLIAFYLCSFQAVARRDILRSLALNPEDRSGVFECASASHEAKLLLHALTRPEVRTVFYIRLEQGTLLDRVMRLLLKPIYRGQIGVEFQCYDIGPGFVIAHGQCTMIGATKIGRDVTVFQNVTVGLAAGDTMQDFRTIGDRAWIWGGSMILGCDIGADTTIAAGAIVTRDVPDGATVAGVPARIVAQRAVDDGSVTPCPEEAEAPLAATD